MPDPRLEAAYRVARYRIDVGGRWIERRIGGVDAEADTERAGAIRNVLAQRWRLITRTFDRQI